MARQCVLLLCASWLLLSTPTWSRAEEWSLQPIYLPQVAVTFNPGIDVGLFAQANGLTINRVFAGDPYTYVFNAPTVARAAEVVQQITGAPGVRHAYQDRISPYRQFFTPNDPFFNNPSPPNNFGGQWHLGNNISGSNVNVVPAWNRNVTGAGVVIGIVDSGMEGTHEDIAPNYSAANSFDFINNSSTITLLSGDRHGQAVGGVAAARGGNGIGVTGAAPFATVSTLRVFNGDTSPGSDTAFADATTFNSSGSNTTIKIKNHSYGISSPYVGNGTQVNAVQTSAAAGTIHVVAAGNDRGTTGEDSNRKDFQNTPEVITVAALGRNGIFSSYSCFGANVFITAPSSSSGQLSITTTDRTGTLGYNTSGNPGDYSNLNYTAGFGGTSSASPLAAGVLALAKQVNPNMDVRLAKHLLVRTSTIVDAGDSTPTSDGGWRTNAAGFTFNQNYGFGLINADALTLAAGQFFVTPLVTNNSGNQTVNAAIPDNSAVGVTRTVTNNVSGFMEEVEVTMSITHAARGQIEIYITSPSGYTSRLTRSFSSSVAMPSSWIYISNAFWGEQAQGVWSVNVRDVASGTTGTWNSFSVNWRMGTIVAIPEPTTIALFGLGLGAAGYGWWRRRSFRNEEEAVSEILGE
jgi:subtilisin family serine protease